MSDLIKKIPCIVEVPSIKGTRGNSPDPGAPSRDTGSIEVHQFYGGTTRGKCIQLNLPQNCSAAQLDRDAVIDLVNVLDGWLLHR